MSSMNGLLTQKDRDNIKSMKDNSMIYLAEVMDTRSPLRNGEIKVWIIKTASNKKDPSNWITARCVSPMFGNTINDDSYDEDKNISYGWWNPVPYVGNYVFVFFPSVVGENTSCYWFGSPIEVSNCMLPGISYDLTKDNNTDYKPVYDKNYLKKKNNKSKSNTTNDASSNENKNSKKDDAKEYTILSKALETQGLKDDRLRGISTASSFRETPSRCYGFLSPLGNQFVIDDGWVSDGEKKSWVEDARKKQENQYIDKEMHKGKDDYGLEHASKEWKAELKEGSKDDKLNRFHGGFKFRTRNGTQLLILDCGTIYMINKDGSAWMELSDDGYIDCYSKKGISASSEGDINLHSDKNINIDCSGKLNISAKQGIIMETPVQINANSGTFNVSSNISTENISANTGIINTFKSSNVELNGTLQGTLQGTAYYATYAGSIPIKQPEPNIKEQEIIPPTLKIEKNTTNGSQSTVSRKPRHEPWKEHDKNDCIPQLNSLGKPNNKNDSNDKNDKNDSNDLSNMENIVKNNMLNNDEMMKSLIKSGINMYTGGVGGIIADKAVDVAYDKLTKK